MIVEALLPGIVLRQARPVQRKRREQIQAARMRDETGSPRS